MRLFASVFVLLLAVPALASTPIDQVRPLDPAGRVDIENLKGRIQVQGWDRNEVKITGTLGEGVERLVIEGDRRQLEVRVKYPDSGGWGGKNSRPTDLRLMVPLRASLSIDSVSAEVEVTGVAPRSLSIDSVSGGVTVAGAPGEISVDSVSGDIRLTVNSSEVGAESVSGGIVLRGRMNGKIDAESVSGSIDVLVNGERIQKFNGNSVSGNITLDAALANNGEIRMETISGRLALVLPSDLSAQVRGESMSGTLRAPGVRVERPRYGPGSSYRTRYGSGNGEISLQTLSGNAELKFK